MNSVGAQADSAASGAQDWRRLSPRMLLVHPVKELIRFLPAVLGLLIAGSARQNGQWWWGLVATAVAVGLGLLRWYTTRYRITPEQVQLRTGLFSRKTLTAPIDRVRTVDVTASPLHRLLGLAEVRVGTGAGADDHELALDGLTASAAAALRGELLHRQATGHAERPTDVPEFPSAATSFGYQRIVVDSSEEQEIVRLDPRWVRFAPFGPSGLLAAAAIIGVGMQMLNEAGWGPDENATVRHGLDQAQRVGLWVAALLLTAAVAVLIVLLALGGYVLLYWGFRLTRHRAGGTLQVTRGLLTTRSTTLETKRIRGVELSEPLLLRLARGARLSAITTGLKDGGDEGQSSLLTPPAPVAVVRRVADQVLDAPGVSQTPLLSHGPVAARRRYTRALLGGGVLAVALTVSAGWLLTPSAAAVGVMPLVGALLLARDRVAALGHTVTDRYLISRAGSVVRTTDLLERTGVLGVMLRRSFFQRRVGLATLTVVTAAGRQRYLVRDVPHEQSLLLAQTLLPGHLEAFER